MSYCLCNIFFFGFHFLGTCLWNIQNKFYLLATAEAEWVDTQDADVDMTDKSPTSLFGNEFGRIKFNGMAALDELAKTMPAAGA